MNKSTFYVGMGMGLMVGSLAMYAMRPKKNGVKTVSMKARKAAPRGYSQILMEYVKGLPVRMVLEEFGGISTEYLFKY